MRGFRTLAHSQKINISGIAPPCRRMDHAPPRSLSQGRCGEASTASIGQQRRDIMRRLFGAEYVGSAYAAPGLGSVGIRFSVNACAATVRP